VRARVRAAHATRSALPRLYTGHDAPPPANRAARAWIRRGPGVGEGGEPAPRARGCRVTDGGSIWRRYLAVPARGAHGYDLSAAGFLPLFSLLSIGDVFKQIR